MQERPCTGFGVLQVCPKSKLQINWDKTQKNASNKIHPNDMLYYQNVCYQQEQHKRQADVQQDIHSLSVSSLSFTLVGPGSSAPFSHQTKHLCSRHRLLTIMPPSLSGTRLCEAGRMREALWGSCGLTSQDTQPAWWELEEGLVTPEQPEHWLKASECELPLVLWKTRWHFLVMMRRCGIVHSTFILSLSLGPDCLTH